MRLSQASRDDSVKYSPINRKATAEHQNIFSDNCLYLINVPSKGVFHLLSLLSPMRECSQLMRDIMTRSKTLSLSTSHSMHRFFLSSELIMQPFNSTMSPRSSTRLGARLSLHPLSACADLACSPSTFSHSRPSSPSPLTPSQTASPSSSLPVSTSPPPQT